MKFIMTRLRIVIIAFVSSLFPALLFAAEQPEDVYMASTKNLTSTVTLPMLLAGILCVMLIVAVSFLATKLAGHKKNRKNLPPQNPPNAQ